MSGRWRPLFVQIPMPVMERFAELRRRGGRRAALEIDSAFHTYAGLRSFRNNARQSQSFGTACTSARNIAECTGQGRRTVEKNLPRLKAWGVVFLDPHQGAMTIFTFIDAPEMFAKDTQESGPERAKGLVKIENDGVKQKARSKGARDAARRRPPPHAAASPATCGGTPPPPAADTPATCGGPVPPENYEIYEKARAPSGDGVRSLSERTHPNGTSNAPLPAEIAGPFRQLAATKMMPRVRMTPAEEQARRQELWRQSAARPTRSREPYNPSTGEEWDQKEREARAKAAKMLKDYRKEQAAQRAALRQEIR